MGKLDLILDRLCEKSRNGFRHEIPPAKQAILRLMRTEVTPVKEDVGEEGGLYAWEQGWNACRQQMLDNLKKLE